MFCKKCGAPVNQGELFCSACGEKIEAAGPAQYAAQPAYRQPNAQPAYGQPQQGAYGRPPYGQPPKRKSKALIWAIVGIVAALAVAAVLVFVVFPAGGGNWPFAGNTTQTKFVNDSVKVFSGSFSGIGNGDTFTKLGKEPFELGMDMTASVAGQENTARLDAAYDNKSFGLRLEQGGSATTVLLLENVLYSQNGGTTNGIRFDTKADLSQPMSLDNRLKALLETFTNQQAATTKVDFGRLAEMLVNSIDEGCFVKSGDTATLTLDIDDIIQTLKNFSDKLENDKKMLQDIQDYSKEISGVSMDVISLMDTAISALEAQKGSLNFKIVWAVKYSGGAPASLEITFDDGSGEYTLAYGYKKTGAKTDIDFSVTAAGVAAATGTISYEKTAGGMRYSVDIVAGGQSLTLNGSEEIKGDDASGDITINVPGTGEVAVKYDETLKFGAPSKSVADDERFAVDTQNATVTDASGLMNPMGASGLGDPSSMLPSGF